MQERVEKEERKTVPDFLYPKLVSEGGTTPRIKDEPPLIFHPTAELAPGVESAYAEAFAAYRESLPEHTRIYIRQLRDMKLSALIEDWDTGLLRQYARMCAQSLARAHARSGDAAMISGYMGSGQTFDDAIGEFAVEYSDQNRKDFRTFVRAVREGRIQAIVEAD
jgi:hypothetical protein